MESNIEAMNRISINEFRPDETFGRTRNDDHVSESPSSEPSDDSNYAIPAGAENSGHVCRMDASTQTTESLTIPNTARSISETGVSNVPRVNEDRPYVWQFLDYRGFWIDYGHVTSLGARDSGVYQSSDQIENEYRKGHRCYFVRNKNNQYEVNFAQMIQMNTHSLRVRPVRRIQKSRVVRSDGSQPWELLPNYWTDMGTQAACGPSIIIPIYKNSSESLHFTNIVNFSLPRSVIREFYRIQAPHLYRCYQIRKASLERLYPGVRYSEEYMYHGTQRSNVHNICQENIDWRRHGTANGEQEGRGAYFSNLFQLAAVFGIQKRESSQNHPAFGGCMAQGASAMTFSVLPPPIMSLSVVPLSVMPRSATPISVISSEYQQGLPAIATQPSSAINDDQTYSRVPGIPNPLQATGGFPQRPQNINGFLNMDCVIGEKEITIIIAKVLIGRMRLGEKSIIIPGDDVDGVPIDTTVDTLINPRVFVKYHIEEYYPEYCIVLDN